MGIYCISLVIRQRFFFFQNNPKNLNPSYKMDLDLLDCLGRVKLVSFHTDLKQKNPKNLELPY